LFIIEKIVPPGGGFSRLWITQELIFICGNSLMWTITKNEERNLFIPSLDAKKKKKKKKKKIQEYYYVSEKNY